MQQKHLFTLPTSWKEIQVSIQKRKLSFVVSARQVIGFTVGLRLTAQEEQIGADSVEHGVSSGNVMVNQEAAEAAQCLLNLHYRDGGDSDERVALILSRLLNYNNQNNLV